MRPNQLCVPKVDDGACVMFGPVGGEARYAERR